MSILLSLRPIVTRRTFEMADQAASAREELLRIQKLNDDGAWYVNPMFTVRSAAPDAAFFEEAQNRLGAFFGEMRRRLRSHWRGKRLIDKSRLSWKEFSLTYDGVFLIHGQLRECRDLNTIANECLGDLQVTPTADAVRILQTGDLSLFEEFLKLEREELESYPEISWFLIPSCRIVAAKHSSRFEAECKKQWQDWNRNIRRLRKQDAITPEFAAEVRKLRFSSDSSLGDPLPLS